MYELDTAAGRELAVVPDPLAAAQMFPPGVSVRIERGRRARRLPYLCAAATYAAGWLGEGLGELADLTGGADAHTVTVGGYAATVTAAAAVAALYRRRIAWRWRTRWLLALAAAAGWVDVAAVVGPPGWWMTAACAAGWAAIAAPWMREYAVDAPLEAEPVDMSGDVGAVIERRWVDRVGRQGGVISGSALTNRVDHPHAIEWTVTTVPGSTTFDQMLSRRGNVAAALHYPAAKIVLEPSDEDEGHAILTVVTRDILAAGVPYLGPRYGNGRIPVALYADGRGWADYVAFEDNTGVRSGCLSGDPGAGKSALAEAIGLGLRQSGRYYVIFGDGDAEGRSSELLLSEVAHWGGAGPQDVMRQLEAVEEILDAHGALLGTLCEDGRGGMKPITDPDRERVCRFWIPCERYPAVYWIIDELHRLVTDQWMKDRGFVARLEKVLRLCRKLGVGVLTGSQSLLAGDFGSSTQLRAYLAARNCFALRNTNRSESAVIAGLQVAPSTLPTVGKGYAYATGDGRLAMCRVAWAPDMHRYVAALPPVALCPYTARAVAMHRPVRPMDRRTALAERRARLEAWMLGGKLSDAAAIEAGPSAKVLPFAVPGALGAPSGPPAGEPGPAPTPAPPADEDRETAAQSPLEDVYAPPDTSAWRPAWRAVYDALAAGHRTTADIAAACARPKPTVSNALTALRELGVAHKVGHGEHALGPDPSGEREDFDQAAA